MPITAMDPFAGYKTVTEVNGMITNQFNTTACFANILVKGEVTNFSGANNGHYYFAIKDSNALLPCVMWKSVAETKLRFKFESGKKVAIAGKLEFYGKNGRSQLIVKQIADMGAGEANLKYLELKTRLEAEGLFDEDHKKTLPKFPRQIGIVTSKNGQARQDIEKVAAKRNPYVQLLLYHVNVQGDSAVRTIMEGISELDRMGLDAIIVGRGGGSAEELIAYNDEALARLIYNAKTPIISAVGHAGNWSLIDYVADKRVVTPTEAAQEAIPDVMTTIHQIRQYEKNISDNMRRCLDYRILRLKTEEAKLQGNDPVRKLKEHKDRLSVLSDGLDQKMKLIYEKKKDRLGLLSEGLTQKMNIVYERKRNRFSVLVAQLNGLSPTAKLVQGFGYISSKDKPVRSIEDVSKGDTVDIRIHDGHIITTVNETAGLED